MTQELSKQAPKMQGVFALSGRCACSPPSHPPRTGPLKALCSSASHASQDSLAFSAPP